MSFKPMEEKTKPFRLVKYFTFASLIVIFIGTIVLSFLNIHWARTLQFKKSQDYALLLIENLNHQVYTQFQIPVYYIFGKIQLRNRRQFELMDKIVRNTLHSFKIDTVNLYDVNDNIISYSFEPSLVGQRDLGGEGYRNAVLGQSTSRLVQKGNFWETLLGRPHEIKVITFAPLREAKPLTRISGKVLGVIEVVQDLSEDYKTIFRFQIRVIITCTLVMSLLLVILIFVVKKGEAIIEQRNRERMRLREQLNRAERLSSLGEMVAGISHEIRNPLGIIKSSAELLKKKMEKIPASGAIPDIIVEESDRLNNIITDFLDYAKPRAPHLKLCHMDEVLEKNITFLTPQIEAQGYIVKKQYDRLPVIAADPDMMYQVFLNLMINAMQSMPGGGEIQIIGTSDRKNLTLIFKDKGEGVPAEVMEKIWDPFFTTKETGTGLGLGIVRNIIEAHGGTIRIENRPIYGAQVVIGLPIKAENI
ncbi:two-component sensor histidine kinase [Desulfonema ishimotonii]|uniref:histidine kinase n=1 Tax=Desulfonema ishimotonii TaxID=45657 RepID=A0A401G216_9BACT|nr:ATP-binding protein [Desulfonema ishimotonii]GBC63269.1 two-component sensor histidine kinase [Desulfonema ishimotonii]